MSLILAHYRSDRGHDLHERFQRSPSNNALAAEQITLPPPFPPTSKKELQHE
jgi:hypothetical protein